MFQLGLSALVLGFVMVGHYSPWVAFEHQWVAAAGGLLIGLAAPRGRDSERFLRLPLLAAAALGLATVPLLQLWLGQVWFRSDAFLPATYLLGFAACVVAGRAYACGRDRRLSIGLMAMLLAAALLSTVIALLQWQQLKWSMFIVDLEPGDRPYGNLAQPNHLALLIAMGAAGLMGLYESRRLTGLTAALTMGFLGWGLVMTQSRAGWLFVVLWVVWWAVQRRRSGLQVPVTAVAIGLLAFVAAVRAWGPINDALLQSTHSLASRLVPDNRAIHWATLWDAALRQPWLGYGWSQVTLAQQAAVLDHPATGEWLMQSHNLLLDLVLQNGIPVALAVVGCLLWWFVRQARGCNSVTQWALLGAVGMVFLHSMVEFPLDYTYFLVPTGLMMGMLEGLHPAPARSAPLPRALWAGALAVLAAMLLWIGTEYLRVDAAARQLRFVMAGVGLDKVPDAPPPDVWLLDEPREFHRYWMTPARPGMSADELEWMRRISMRQAAAPAMLRYAFAAGVNGHSDEAAQVLRRLCRMNNAQRCDEGRESWRVLQNQFEVLSAIPYPVTPQELQGPPLNQPSPQ